MHKYTQKCMKRQEARRMRAFWLAVKWLSICALLHNPRSKNERGLYYKSLSINRLSTNPHGLNTTKKAQALNLSFFVRVRRVELPRANAHHPLKVACLPFHHTRIVLGLQR